MIDARPDAESASERAPCVAGMTALALFPSASFLEDRADSWQEQAKAWGNEVSASDEFDVLLEQPQSIVSKCSWWSGSTTYSEEGAGFSLSTGGCFQPLLPNAGHPPRRGSMDLIFHGQSHEFMCHGAAVCNHGASMAKGPSRWSAVYLRA